MLRHMVVSSDDKPSLWHAPRLLHVVCLHIATTTATGKLMLALTARAPRADPIALPADPSQSRGV